MEMGMAGFRPTAHSHTANSTHTEPVHSDYSEFKYIILGVLSF